MKLRYQMRGLGIGIIVTALMMGMVKGQKIPLSDAEIKVRALELGMVDSDSRKLSDISDMTAPQRTEQEPGGAKEGDAGTDAGPAGQGEEGADGDSGAQGEAGAGPEESADSGEEGGSGPDAASEGEAEGDGQGADSPSGADGRPAEGDMVTVVIEEGVTSYSVCQLLEELGLIEDADSLDYYICSNSYSRSILEGVYQIPMGTGDEEIVRIIMGYR